VTTQEKKKALIGECITKLGKSRASQMLVDKISDDSGENKGIDKQVHNQIKQVNSKSSVNKGIDSECITKLGKSTASQISVESLTKVSDYSGGKKD
jgi:hypothetical protein